MSGQREALAGPDHVVTNRRTAIVQSKKIFLASSSELKEDRKEFEIFINRKNKEWVNRDVFLELVLWEDFLDALSPTRLQDKYNRAIRECDLFVMLFFTKVGPYTAEEFETAFGQFQATHTPFIFTYFKDAPINTGSIDEDDLMSLFAFKKKLKALGHFFTVYQNLDALKFHFGQQLDKLVASGFIEFKPDKETADGGARNRAHLTGSGAIAQGPGATAVGERGVSVGGKFVGRDDHSQTVVQHYHGFTPTDAEEAEARYRQHIAPPCELLSLQSVETTPAGGEDEPLSLAEIYIGLDTRQSVPVEVIERALANVARGRFDGLTPPRTAEPSAARDANARPVSALEAAILHRRLVLTGEPGSGKSTFVNHLTHALALRRWECLPGWPERERNALPIPVILRDFAHWLGEREKPVQAGANLLWDYIRHELGRLQLSAAAGVLEKALEDGRAVMLLDGLDEVPADDAARLSLMKDSIQRFVERYRNDRHLVTCRVLSYQEPHWRLPARTFPDLELARFDEDQIDRFIGAWYREVGTKWRLSPADIAALSDKLRHAVRRPDLWRLAPNPLLLTVMALVHSRRRDLPEKRALLYEEAVDILLQKREQDKTVNTPQIRELLDEAGRDFNDLKAVLEHLAFDTHGSGVVRDAEDGAPIDTLNLLERVAALHPKESLDWARQLLAVLGLRASLLLERKDKVYSFPHRTFQEYLAGVYLARLDGDEFAKQAAQLASDLPTYWREVVLLAVGYLVHKNRDTSKPRLLVEELCPEHVPDTDLDWRKAWLAGDVLREIGANRILDKPPGRKLLERVTDRLVMLVEQGLFSARERAEAGDTLGELGDPRFKAVEVKGQRVLLPPLVPFAAGPFVMGSDRQEVRRLKKIHQYPAGNELRPDRDSVEVPAFAIGRYPVTNAEFECFIKANGYQTDCWWTTEPARRWRHGELASGVVEDLMNYCRTIKAKPALPRKQRWSTDALEGCKQLVTLKDEMELREMVIKRLTDRPLNQPAYWKDTRFNNPSQPVVGVTWFEAMAYCAWLEAQWRTVGPLTVGESVRLPTEEEWEKAARTPENGRYPWGDPWAADRANTAEEQMSRPSPVGIYPAGATKAGVHDLSGNVWEWTKSHYLNPHNLQNSQYIQYMCIEVQGLIPHSYLYLGSHESYKELNKLKIESPMNSEFQSRLVVRGGCWNFSHQVARCATRNFIHPAYFGRHLGFRVVVSLANTGF